MMKKSTRYFNLAERLMIVDAGDEIVVRRDNWKYTAMIDDLAAGELPIKPAEDEFLFDVDNDPAETINLSAEQPEIMAQLKGFYQQWAKANSSSDGPNKAIEQNRTKLDL
ncbi:hypothetical protein RI844_11660 [Thalassotalea fonticola]|uniref:Uncharacterized protein n=1 Tax=Thalassotalea fonticola TaxID=3065649 RepID=A0ABZ0GJJ3_9GAMM|nr:hypothetical protein RI844_11660 [Colwelliaceae bacterium S1-1]